MIYRAGLEAPSTDNRIHLGLWLEEKASIFEDFSRSNWHHPLQRRRGFCCLLGLLRDTDRLARWHRLDSKCTRDICLLFKGAHTDDTACLGSDPAMRRGCSGSCTRGVEIVKTLAAMSLISHGTWMKEQVTSAKGSHRGRDLNGRRELAEVSESDARERSCPARRGIRGT